MLIFENMKKSNSKKTNKASNPKINQATASIHFPIVGIGASAGGLEALEQFFHNVPKNKFI